MLRDLCYRFKGNKETDAAEDYPADKSRPCFLIYFYADPRDPRGNDINSSMNRIRNEANTS